VHELGHFFIARRNGIRVEKFSLGFGPRLLSRKFGATEVMLCAIPFGGFIKMAGDTAEEAHGASDEFLGRSPGARARVIAAGPAFNYLLAFFSLWAVFYLGYPRLTTTIGEVMKDLPASKADIKVGDKILKVNGESVLYWDDLTKRIHTTKETDLNLEVKRGDVSLMVTIAPERREVETIFGKKIKVALIGIKPSEDVELVRYGFVEALIKGTKTLASMTVMTILSIVYMILGTLSFQESVTGPIGIFFIATNAAKIGPSAVLHVVGILSMSLAIFNMLPLPILDGGHVALAGLEKLRGRRLSVKAEERLGNAGMGLLIILAVFIFCNDLIRYGYWDKFLALFQK
jgi:regulator of sigma E protease